MRGGVLGWRFQLDTLTRAAATMAGYDTNPFADPVDVNPFQVMGRDVTGLEGPGGGKLPDNWD